MEWTEHIRPNDHCGYDHMECTTPLGVFRVEWKSWKSVLSFTLYLDDDIYITSGHDLDTIKRFARQYLEETYNELGEYLESTN